MVSYGIIPDGFEKAARKGEPVFALFSECPDNIPCQRIRMEHKFTDKTLLCNLLGQFIEVLKEEIEIDQTQVFHGDDQDCHLF